jgi:gas vesicle protein
MATKKSVTTTTTPSTTFVAQKFNDLHESALHLTEAVVDETLAAGKKWQAVLAKAMKTSVTIIGHQQEMAFDTLETLKKQYQKGTDRAINLVSKEVKAVKNSVEQAVEEVTAEIEEAATQLKTTAKRGPRKATATAKTTAAKVTDKVRKNAKTATTTVRKTAQQAEAKVAEVTENLLNTVEENTAANN